MYMLLLIVLCTSSGISQDIVFPFNYGSNKIHGLENTRLPLFAPNNCSAHQLLYPGDQENDWICDCEPGFIYSPRDDACFGIYRRGPCPQGQHLILRRGFTIPECVDNPCADGFARFNNTCYELGKPGGPCPPELIGGGIFDVNVTTLAVECIKRIDPVIYNFLDKYPNRTNHTAKIKSSKGRQ